MIHSRHLALIVLATASTAACASKPTTQAVAVGNNVITQAQVEAAQQAWGKALVQISTDFEQGGIAKAKATAEKIIDGAYAYQMGPVLFKPTLTVEPQTFRTTKQGALAYFVGQDSNFPNDKGFALKGWRKVEAKNAGIVITGNSAISMGNVSMWDTKGNMTMVDKTWGWTRGADGNLKIVLHHSSLPYSAK